MTRYAVAPSFLHVHLLTRMFFHVTQSRIPLPSSPPHTQRAHSFDIHLLPYSCLSVESHKLAPMPPASVPRVTPPWPGQSLLCSAKPAFSFTRNRCRVPCTSPDWVPTRLSTPPPQPPPCTPVLGSDSPAWAVCRVGFSLHPCSNASRVTAPPLCAGALLTLLCSNALPQALTPNADTLPALLNHWCPNQEIHSSPGDMV